MGRFIDCDTDQEYYGPSKDLSETHAPLQPPTLGEDLLERCHIFGDVDAVSDLLKLLGSLQGQVLQGREDVGRWVGAHKFL